MVEMVMVMSTQVLSSSGDAAKRRVVVWPAEWLQLGGSAPSKLTRRRKTARRRWRRQQVTGVS